MGQISRFIRSVVCFLLKCYQRICSPFLKPSCRFFPSCSQYAIDAVSQYGVIKGLGFAIWRLLRCHPLSKGGYDPVLPTREKSEWT